MEKEEIINLIKGRIEDEYYKHPLIDLSTIAAIKIYNECFKYFNNQNQELQKDMADKIKVTRFEVIDENGRAYTQKDCNVELSYQDDSRTLKVFIKLNKQDLPIINGSYGCTIETSKNKQD